MVRTAVLATLVPAALVVLGAGGCRGKPGEAGPPCGAVAAKFLELARYDLAHAKVSDAIAHAVTDQLPAIRDALAQACTDGSWSAATRSCLVRANDRTGFETCEQQLTDEQRQALDRGTRGISGSR